MTATRDALPPIRQEILSHFEQAVGREATAEELEKIATKNIRRGSSVFILLPPETPGEEYDVALGTQGTEYATAGKKTASGGGLHEPHEATIDGRIVAVRELSEEVVDDKGVPIIRVNPNDLTPLHKSIDVKMLLPDAPHPEWDIVIAEVFYKAASIGQARDLRVHAKRQANDINYAKASFEHTNNEVGGMTTPNLSAAADEEALKCMQHNHERDGLRKLAQKYLPQ